MIDIDDPGDHLDCLDVLQWCCLSHAEKGHSKSLHALVECGASVNCVDWRGKTPLILAAKYGSRDTVDELLDLGADIGCTDDEHKTALR